MTKHGLGWRPQKPDHRDRLFAAAPVALPASNPRFASGLPPIWDQMAIGSCTSHAILRADLFAAAKAGQPVTMLSRLMLYYEERDIEGTVPMDAGAEIRDGIKALADQGTCREELWPYDLQRFTEKPPASCYVD